MYRPGSCWEEKCKFILYGSNEPANFIVSLVRRERANVYGWIGGDRPSDVLEQAKARKEQGFTAVKMNAVESVRSFVSRRA